MMGRLTSTHTYVILELSRAAFDEIKTKMLHAGYHFAFDEQKDKTIIDMHGIAVMEDDEIKPPSLEVIEKVTLTNVEFPSGIVPVKKEK